MSTSTAIILSGILVAGVVGAKGITLDPFSMEGKMSRDTASKEHAADARISNTQFYIRKATDQVNAFKGVHSYLPASLDDLPDEYVIDTDSWDKPPEYVVDGEEHYVNSSSWKLIGK